MKTIAVRDEVYEQLSRLKKDKESFSDVILRVINEKRKNSIEIFEKYAGSIEDSDILDFVMKERKRFRVREFDL